MPWAYFERVLKRVFKRVFKRSRLTARCISLVCRHGQRAVSLALVRLAGRAGIRLIKVFKRSRLTARYLSLVCRHGQRAVSLALVRLAGRAGIRLTACSLTRADLHGGVTHA